MKTISIPGVHRPISQLVMGSMMFYPHNMELVDELLDAFFAAGGNTIDSAHVYNGGDSERAIGLWMKSRKNREDVIVLTKGCHPDHQGPRVNASALKRDLNDSLERLQTDYIDMYALHRDDPAVPVGEIVEMLNEEIAAGRIRAIGASNWTVERIQAANDYAREHGLVGFSFNSPNLSLAKPNEPRWAGCVSLDHAGTEWHKQTQLPLLSWSSQAGGFFSGAFTPDRTDDPEMVRVYYNDANWERLRRAQKLAADKGVTAIQIACAFVLNQPFPACALIGPVRSSELISSIEATRIELRSEEMDWLDLLTDQQP